MPVSRFEVYKTGLLPEKFEEETRRKLVILLNDQGTLLETEVVQATPANVGDLRRGWQFTPASLTQKNPVARVTQNKRHFLPVEMGRRPGKGISAKGQEKVARWAVLKGIVVRTRNEKGQFNKSKEAANFAFLLSRKYKKEGRPAVGFLGLAKPGTIPTNPNIPENPITDSLLDKAFKRLRDKLNRL